MKRQFSWNGLSRTLRRQWFNILLIGLVIFVLLRKDFSFSINLNKPERQEQMRQLDGLPSAGEKKEKTPLLTQKPKEVQKAQTSTASMLDRFKLPWIGSGDVSIREKELANIDDNTKLAYLRRFAHVAQNEQKKFGIPASIILANGLLQSLAGQRDFAISSNNHFAIPCSLGWAGGQATYQGDCMREYATAWDSFRDHSIYISSGRYEALIKLGAKDYKGWAKALENKGFSGRAKLANQLIQLIERHELYLLD